MDLAPGTGLMLEGREGEQAELQQVMGMTAELLNCRRTPSLLMSDLASALPLILFARGAGGAGGDRVEPQEDAADQRNRPTDADYRAMHAP